MAHIQTQAAQKRYEDYGLKEVQVWADEDERRCEICGELHQKKYPIGAVMPIPAHPRCRCCIIPVVD
jgi:SPP1 gp7 family putative phage head morphogenesis protein